MAVGEYVTAEGLKIPTVEKLLTDLSTDQRANINPNLDTEADSPSGQLNGLFASPLREAYEVLQVAYNGFDPDQAEGVLLDGISALTGTTRAAATRSRFTGSRKLQVSLEANKTVVAGSVTFHVDGDPAVRFVTSEDVSSTVAGVYLVSAVCDQDGEVHCNAGTLTIIATPLVGLNAVYNPFDAIVGRAQDNTAALRRRRGEELRATGSGTVPGLEDGLDAIKLEDNTKPILSVTIFENETNDPDPVTGLPPHSLECMVFDGIVLNCPDNTIAQTIWNNRPGGIQLIGTTSGTAIDKRGKARTVPFTRPTIVEVKFAITIEVLTGKYAGDDAAVAAIQAAFVAHVNAGKKIRATDYVAALKTLAGVIDVPNVQIARVGDAFPANGTNLTLDLREIGNADSSNISITTVPGEI